MSEVRISTLADYRPSHRVTAECRACLRSMDLEQLGERYGWHARLVELGRRLRCSQCQGEISLSVRPARKIDYR